MKFRWVVLSLAIAMSITACGEKTDTSEAPVEIEQEETTVDALETEEATIPEVEDAKEDTDMVTEGSDAEFPEASYREVLDQFVELIESNDIENGFEGSSGVQECMMGASAETVLEDVGYTIADYSGDDIPELIIGSVFEGENGSYINDIYALYTLVDGKPKLVFEGWARNRYCILEDDTIYNAGSGGAMYSMFGTYSLSKDGQSLVCKDFYFTYEKNDDLTEFGFYHNTTGEWDKNVSEELDITEEEFWKFEEDTYTKNKKLDLTSLADYKN